MRRNRYTDDVDIVVGEGAVSINRDRARKSVGVCRCSLALIRIVRLRCTADALHRGRSFDSTRLRGRGLSAATGFAGVEVVSGLSADEKS